MLIELSIAKEIFMATIYDVSRETGYSIATVSKVINNYRGVNKNTKKIIEEKIEELGFVPNNTARTLATQKSWLIAIIFEEEQELGILHPHYSNILQGFKRVVGKYGYDIIFFNTFLGEKKMTFLEHCKFRNVDGVIIALDKCVSDKIDKLLKSDIPKVSVESIYSGVPTVISDNVMATRQILEHLFMLGHKKIAMIAAPINSTAGAERYKAYREFLDENDLKFEEKYCVEANKYTKEAGIEACNILLQQSWDDLPTAIYAAYDDYACAVRDMFGDRGFRVPEDISIVGNDDLPIAEYTTPGMTTVRQNREKIGEKAAEILVDIIEKRKVMESEVVRIPMDLVVRGTTFRKN